MREIDNYEFAETFSPQYPPFLFFLNGEKLGEKIELKFPYIIGRSSEANLTLSDTSISRVHARFEMVENMVYITDLKSKNGIVLNGKILRKPTFLKSYDLIRIGQSLILFNHEIPVNIEKFGSKRILEVAANDETYYDVSLDPIKVNSDNLDRDNLSDLFELIVLFQNESSEPKTLLEKALKRIMTLFKADQSSIYLLNIETGKYEPGVIVSEELTPSIPINILRRCAREKRAFMNYDLWNDTAEGMFLKSVENRTRSLMVAPLTEGDSCSGILALSSNLPRFFNSRSLEMCSIIARHLAKNLSNAALWDKLLKRYKAEEIESENDFIGDSQSIKDILRAAKLIARERVSVLITGESGVGKEVLARYIYKNSSRSNGPFVPINCACIPKTLIESELFGAERGAYTGATERRIGKFELADAGTLFLDEIGELPIALQPKLLRILETGKFYRLGGKEEISCDVRIICATNRDIESAVRAKDFREDLYYRINVAHLHIPPLRERAGDILQLVNYFLSLISKDLNKTEPLKLAPDAVPQLLSYKWPGNVRELKNILERVSLFSGSPVLNGDMFKRELSQKSSSVIKDEPKISESIKMADIVMEVEKNLIINTLRENDWKKAPTAAQLGISRPTLDKKMRDYGIESDESAPEEKVLVE